MPKFNLSNIMRRIKHVVANFLDLDTTVESNDDTWAIAPSHKKRINSDLANFILDQAEKALKVTAETSDKITNRAFTVLLILIPIFSTLIGLIINAIKKSGHLPILDISFFLSLTAICVYAIFHLVRLVFPRNFMSLGRQPSEIVVAEMLDTDLADDKRLMAFKFNEIKNCQNKISFNRRQNAKRILVLSKILKLISISALAALFIYLVILCLLETLL